MPRSIVNKIVAIRIFGNDPISKLNVTNFLKFTRNQDGLSFEKSGTEICWKESVSQRKTFIKISVMLKANATTHAFS